MTSSVKENLGRSLRMMLKPLAKLLIAQGITHKEFSEAAKEAYVEVALRHFQKGEALNRSRVAIVTGLTRKEVANVISRALDQSPQGKNFSRPSRVLHGWHNDPDYTGPYGMPLEIPYEISKGVSEPPSFVHLVKTYSGDQSPLQMLDELLRAGAIVKLDDETYKPIRRDFEPQSLSPKLIERFGDIGFNLFSTLAANVQKKGQGEGIFDRVVISNQKLTETELGEFKSYLNTRGQSVLEEMDNWLTRTVSTKDSESEKKSYETGLAMLQYIIWDPSDKSTLRDFLIESGVDINQKDSDDN
jgi:Family of unknown function (DUF6502)